MVIYGQATNQPAHLASSSSDPAPSSIPTKLTIKPLKGVIHKFVVNPRARVAQNYDVVEDLAQSSLTMLTLEVF